MNTIYLSAIVGMILFYIYETQVVWEYLNELRKLFGKSKKADILFNGILLIEPYVLEKTKIGYMSYLNRTYNKFYTKLAACPICFGFWLSVLCSLFVFNPLSVGAIAALSLFIYYVMKYLTKLVSQL